MRICLDNGRVAGVWLKEGVQYQPGAEASQTDSEELGTQFGQPDSQTDSQPASVHWLLWIGLMIAVALTLGAVLWQKSRKKKASSGQSSSSEGHAGGSFAGGIAVGKLHEQGARDGQQDCFSVSPEEMYDSCGLLAVVADGMGGLSDGDKVSQAAVTAMMNGFFEEQGEGQQVLLSLLKQANRAVNNLLGPGGYSRSGSTLVAGLIRDGAFHYLSVGDSRICLYRDGALYQLNREHVFRNELFVRAVNDETTLTEAYSHPKGAGLTSFLGMGRLKYVDLPARPVKIRPGDTFILMSDGVYNAVTEDEMTEALRQDAPQAAQALGQIIQDKAYTGQDNYTAVILQCR